MRLSGVLVEWYFPERWKRDRKDGQLETWGKLVGVPLSYLTVWHVLGTLICFWVLQFPLCKGGVTHLILQRLWDKFIQDSAVFKFLRNAGQVRALGKLEMSITYWQLQANHMHSLHWEIQRRTVNKRKNHRKRLETWSISQKPVKGKYFLGLRHLWLTWIHAVMWEQLGGHCSELVAECHMRHCNPLSWWVPLASVHYLWEIAGNLEINKCEVLLLCLVGLGWGGVFQIRNYFMCTQGLVYVALYVLLSQMAVPAGNIAIVLKLW